MIEETILVGEPEAFLEGCQLDAPVRTLERVLVADAEEELGRALCARLERAGVRAACAPDGVTALELCRATEPDLVILGLELPRMSGFQVLHRLRTTELPGPPPVIALSDGDGRSEDRARRWGCVKVFRKPVRQRDVVWAALDALDGVG